ncbi:hypothetical protein RJZ57_000093, partial [Blastomyces gilchristii]
MGKVVNISTRIHHIASDQRKHGVAETTSDDRQTTWTSTGRAVGLIRNVRSSNEEELKLSRLILDSAFVCSHGQSSLLI